MKITHYGVFRRNILILKLLSQRFDNLNAFEILGLQKMKMKRTMKMKTLKTTNLKSLTQRTCFVICTRFF